MPKPRIFILVLVAVLLAGLFVRLGFWQVSRHHERVAENRVRATRGDKSLLDWAAPGAAEVPRDTAGLLWRRVRVSGRYDRAREIVLRGRSFEGRPGVEVLTPLLVGEAAILVLRGWMPSPDALRADLTTTWPADWDDSATVTVEGTLIPNATGRAGQPLTIQSGGREHVVLAGADLEIIGVGLPYPLRPHVLRLARGIQGVAALEQPRVTEPNDGPHAAYAVQWFAFAVISLVGTGILVRRDDYPSRFQRFSAEAPPSRPGAVPKISERMTARLSDP